MGEIDTKPIESVQNALSFFDQKNDQQKSSPPTEDEQQVEKERELENLEKKLANIELRSNQQVEKERELENLEKELANIKLQLEAKDSAYRQALLELDHHHKTADELATLLRNSDFQKDFYISKCREAKTRINELESVMETMAHQLSESEKAQLQLSHVTSVLESTQNQLFNVEVEVAALREAKMESLSQAEAMEKDLNEEKLKSEEFLRRVSEMNETIIDLENQLLEKSSHIDSLQIELNRANELKITYEKAASDTTSELKQLKQDLHFQEEKNSDQADYINLLETELHQMKENFENMKTDLEKTKEKENDAQVEVALLKFELHKGRSKLAAAEAAESRTQVEKAALYNALQKMGLEAEETKKENRALKESMKLADEEVFATTREQFKEDISMEEDVGPTQNEKRVVEPLRENGEEVENTNEELEIAMSKIVELRTRVEQAITRAEAAEKAKSALEDMIKRRKEIKQKRKAAIAALREETVSRDFGKTDIVLYDAVDTSSAKNYQPLGKVLNMKF